MLIWRGLHMQRQSHALKSIGETPPSLFMLGHSNVGVWPEEGVMLRSLPWWVLCGARSLMSIRIGLSHCCITGLASQSCGLAYSLCCLVLSFHLPQPSLMHGVVLVCHNDCLTDCVCASMSGATVMGPPLTEEGSSTLSHWSTYMVLCIPWWTCTIPLTTDSCSPLWHHSQQLLYSVHSYKHWTILLYYKHLSC